MQSSWIFAHRPANLWRGFGAIGSVFCSTSANFCRGIGAIGSGVCPIFAICLPNPCQSWPTSERTRSTPTPTQSMFYNLARIRQTLPEPERCCCQIRSNSVVRVEWYGRF